MSRQLKRTVSGVALRRGLKPHSWYAGIGPNNVKVEFRPKLGRHSRVPIEWHATKVGVSEVVHAGYLCRELTLKDAVEKVVSMYWGDGNCDHGAYVTMGRKDYPFDVDQGPYCPTCEEVVEL